MPKNYSRHLVPSKLTNPRIMRSYVRPTLGSPTLRLMSQISSPKWEVAKQLTKVSKLNVDHSNLDEWVNDLYTRISPKWLRKVIVGPEKAGSLVPSFGEKVDAKDKAHLLVLHSQGCPLKRMASLVTFRTAIMRRLHQLGNHTF